MRVYLNDEKKIVDPRLLYNILQGLKAFCGNSIVAKIEKCLIHSRTAELILGLNTNVGNCSQGFNT